MTAPRRNRYATDRRIRQFVTLGRDMGLDVAGFEVSPDGHIRVMEARALPDRPATDFDRFADRL